MSRLVLVLLLLLLTGATLQAQAPDTVVLRLLVTDSLGRPVGGANVALRLGDGRTIEGDTTTATGDIALTLLHPPATFQLVVRRIGFVPYVKELARKPTIAVNVVLAMTTVSLDTMKITEQEALRHRVYHLDAAAIAASPRPIYDGWDLLQKLRPDIAYGRGNCPGVQQLWINGVWMPPQMGVVNDLVVAREPQKSAATPHLNRRVTTDKSRLIAMSTLALIRPQDVEEMTFRDCNDFPIDTPPPSATMHSSSALFVILKPGVKFDPARGSYVPKPPNK